MAYTAWSVVFGEQPSAAKWNQLGSNDAHFYSFLGDNLAWQTWSPTWTNVSGGATTYAKYIEVGNTVHFRIKYTLGGAGVSGDISFTPPVTLHSDYTINNAIEGSAILLDTGTQGYSAQFIVNSTTSLLIRPLNAGATNLTYGAAASSSNPIAVWASGDVIQGSGTYEGA